MINELPMVYKDFTPIITGTVQWKVPIIDQFGPHGINDTRYPNQIGLGAGYLRLYTDSEGIPKGYSWSLGPKSKYIDDRPLVIGRLK